MAYTQVFSAASVGYSKATGLSIEMAVEPGFPESFSFRFLFLAHDGKDDEQLVIGQWRTSLVIMNGDDYSNRRRLPKIYLQLDETSKKAMLVSILSDETGTKIYLDGALIKSSETMVLRFPGNNGQARLVLGNSMNGSYAWVGTIYGLAVYDRVLSQEAVQQHYQRWQSDRNFTFFREASPKLLYSFDEGRGHTVFNKMGHGPDFIIPASMKVLQKKVLTWPSWRGVAGWNLTMDMLLNLIGFIPLGIVLMGAINRLEGIGPGYSRLIAVAAAFAFSLFIEVVQVWIPLRDSSMLDLLLNTAGGYLGVLLSGRIGLKIISAR